MPQSDEKTKLRLVLLLKKLPGYNDFLVCGISTQLHQFIKNFDEIIDEKSDAFIETGLRQSSIIRLGFLAVIVNHKIAGSIGNINKNLYKTLLNRLGNFLIQ